jgi:hypothetical protein
VRRTRRSKLPPPLVVGVALQTALDRRIGDRVDTDLASTRRLSALLVGSMIRASTSCRNTSSPLVASSNPSAS